MLIIPLMVLFGLLRIAATRCDWAGGVDDET
jgi:hypothetical protein